MMILTNDDIDPVAAMPVALDAIESALRNQHDGALVAPPRHRVTFPHAGGLFFTIGGNETVAGFRVYDTFDGPAHTQLTVVWSTRTAELIVLVRGDRLGEIRTGAIGGVAVRLMSNPEASTIGIIGSGNQARAQLLAVAAVRPLTRVRVFSPNTANREAFAIEMGAMLGLPIEAVGSAELATREADIVICATSSETPVIDASWLEPGAHVNTVGPKTASAHELGLDVARRASIVATDSIAQTRAYTNPFFLDGSDADRMVELCTLIDGKVAARQHQTDITLFCSTGLAGTEVLVAKRLLEISRPTLSGGRA
jgi:ornithine cyclodeaminase/alanine dehydrogenase-like protein (mu-crystallin family)